MAVGRGVSRRNRGRRGLPVWLPAAISVLLLTGNASAEHLRILHTNDMHARLLPFATSAGDTLGGMARLATLVARERAGRPATLLLNAGDIFQGTPFYNFFKGEAEFRVASAIGFNAMVMGNHELDDGPQNLLTQARRHACFPLLCANVETGAPAGSPARPAPPGGGSSARPPAPVDSTWRPIALPWVILTAGDLRVGIIGVTTAALPTIVSRKSFEGLRARPVIETVRRLVPQVRARADLVVVLSHCGLSADSALARAVPGIDVIVAGHDHQALPAPGRIPNPADDNGLGGVLLVESGQWGENLGELDLDVRNGKIASYSGRLLPVTRDVPESPSVAAIIDGYLARLRPLIEEVVGQSAVPLPSDSLRTAETAIGNLVADAMRRAVVADIAVENGGGIRGPLPRGPIRMGDVYTILPFPNTIVTVGLTGRQVEELCREMAGKRGSGGFGQVSGLAFDLVRGVPTGIRVGGRPIEPSRVYKVATNSFTAGGGDGYVLFRKGLDYTDTGVVLRDALIAELKRAGTVSPRVEGRVRIIP
jgi:2',3'-cyclic-nucleotide 2'-phosphodiesterase (5'-nucleotidase family)